MTTPILTERRCQNCKFRYTERQPGAKQMFCRRNPPQATIIMVPSPKGPQPVPIAAFPPVQPEMFCGEWGPRIMHAHASALETA